MSRASHFCCHMYLLVQLLSSRLLLLHSDPKLPGSLASSHTCKPHCRSSPICQLYFSNMCQLYFVSTLLSEICAAVNFIVSVNYVVLKCVHCSQLYCLSVHECKIHCLLASVNFMLALLSQNFLVSSGKLILPKMLRISQQKISKARSRCFQVPQHTKSLYQLKNKIYLFRFGHTNALLFQKNYTKWTFFPSCRN